MIRKFTLFAATLIAVLTTAAPVLAASADLKVEGMTCRMCPRVVEKALERTEGVKEADVSYKNKVAIVEYDPDKISPEGLIKAIEEAGYRATVVERKR